KDHWEEMRQNRWMDLDTEIRERHRDDLLQVLAYSALSDAKLITACLAYPCTSDTWDSLRVRGQLYRRGRIHADKREIEVVLIALPMGLRPQELAEHLGAALSSDGEASRFGSNAAFA
ncbi:MAG TPA: hypothetical protein VMB21_18595, partial [Candidatus Limnocylindria bacterium]|nr:hypothetical protein [Candidatus Limnocylindria bacterium]